jgi:hypothetical protein
MAEICLRFAAKLGIPSTNTSVNIHYFIPKIMNHSSSYQNTNTTSYVQSFSRAVLDINVSCYEFVKQLVIDLCLTPLQATQPSRTHKFTQVFRAA